MTVMKMEADLKMMPWAGSFCVTLVLIIQRLNLTMVDPLQQMAHFANPYTIQVWPLLLMPSVMQRFAKCLSLMTE
jgi:hypothetical protein